MTISSINSNWEMAAQRLFVAAVNYLWYVLHELHKKTVWSRYFPPWKYLSKDSFKTCKLRVNWNSLPTKLTFQVREPCCLDTRTLRADTRKNCSISYSNTDNFIYFDQAPDHSNFPRSTSARSYAFWACIIQNITQLWKFIAYYAVYVIRLVIFLPYSLRKRLSASGPLSLTSS